MLRFGEMPEDINREVLQWFGGRKEFQIARPHPFGDTVLCTHGAILDRVRNVT
jgi:hypothetical protein